MIKHNKLIQKLLCFALSIMLCVIATGNTPAQSKTLVRSFEAQEQETDFSTALDDFNNIEFTVENGNSLCFVGNKTLSASIFDEIDEVSLSPEEDVNVTYNFTYNEKENKCYLTATIEMPEETIEDKWLGVPFTTETGKLDVVFATDDGIIFLSEIQHSGAIDNCGFLSKLLKTIAVVAVVVAVVAVVVVATVYAAPAVVAGAAAASAAISAGAGTVAVAGSAIVAGAAAGSAAVAASAVAGAALTTAAVASAVAVTAYGLDTAIGELETSSLSSSSSSSNSVRKLAPTIPISATLLETIDKISNDKYVYHFAYLRNNELHITDMELNYIEAYTVLVNSGLINATSDVLGKLSGTIQTNLTGGKLQGLINDIKELHLGEDTFGIYTFEEEDAAKLAYVAGGFFTDKGVEHKYSEIHNTHEGSGYYYHFHDFAHVIHVWYGKAQ